MSSNRFYNNPDIGSYLARLLERNGHIDLQRENSITKINPKIVFTFHKNYLVFGVGLIWMVSFRIFPGEEVLII
jgi:hypothetical protein